MSASQLGKRLNMTRQGVVDLEKSERNGTISLNTLRKVAQALSCQLEFALIPEESLNEIVKRQAFFLAQKMVQYSEQQMNLEDQGSSREWQQERIKAIMVELVQNTDKRLWDEE